MLSPPLTIVSFVALLPIRLTICGDPIWAYIEAKAKFKPYTAMPDSIPGNECSSLTFFQMRANGSWLPSSEYDANGYFDENCDVYLHVTIPEADPETVVELRYETEEFDKLKKELKEKEDQLLKEMEEHSSKVEALRNEKERLDRTIKKVNDVGLEGKPLREKSDEITQKWNSIPKRIETFESLVEKEAILSRKIEAVKRKNKRYEEVIRLTKEMKCKKMKSLDRSELNENFNCKDSDCVWICEP